MTTVAALKAHVTRRLQRAEAMGVELGFEPPLDVFEDTDFSFDVCPACETTMGSTHVCSGNIRAARETVLDAMTKALREWGWAWVDFVLGEGDRPKLPKRLAAEARELELRLAGYGLADPLGLQVGTELLRLKRTAPRRHTRSGQQPEELRRHLADRRNHHSGRMY